MTRSRWLFHVTDDRTRPIVAGPEGFVHTSFLPAVEETRRIYFAGKKTEVLAIDPRRVPRIELASTPRGPMPHVWGDIAPDAVRESKEDAIGETKFGFIAFRGMTLLDLVGIHDPIRRMPNAVCEVIGAHEGRLWIEDVRVRPDLAEFDVLVVPGGLGTRELQSDAGFLEWLRTFPKNRLAVSVCTGSLLLGAIGRLQGKRATTHHTAYDELAKWGATVVKERVVDEGDVITGGGVTSALDVGMHVVREIAGPDVAAKIGRQMEYGSGR